MTNNLMIIILIIYKQLCWTKDKNFHLDLYIIELFAKQEADFFLLPIIMCVYIYNILYYDYLCIALFYPLLNISKEETVSVSKGF